MIFTPGRRIEVRKPTPRFELQRPLRPRTVVVLARGVQGQPGSTTLPEIIDGNDTNNPPGV